MQCRHVEVNRHAERHEFDGQRPKLLVEWLRIVLAAVEQTPQAGDFVVDPALQELVVELPATGDRFEHL